jgi:hypothetical protein
VLDNLLSNLASEWREGRTTQPRAELAMEPPQADAGMGTDMGTVAHLILWCPLPASGMGLAPEKLFEPFASGRPGGLGLGLYQARQSLRDAGGTLTAAVVGAQLRFELNLPQMGGV